MAQDQPHVTIVQRVIRNYRVPFYEALRTDLDDHGIGFTLLHNTLPNEEDRRKDTAEPSWASRIPARSVGFGTKRLSWQPAPRSLWASDLVVVEQATSLALNYRLLARRRIGGPKVALWGHGLSPYADASASSEAVKRWFSTQPDWWFAYTDDVAALVRSWGFPPDRVTSVRNATDTRRLAAQMDSVSERDVEALRDRLDVTGGQVGMFVGALVAEKQLDFLITAADAVHAAIDGFRLVVAGDGPMAPWVAEQADRRPWMHYVGQNFGDELAQIMRLASLLMIPSWVGLVVTDGFAAGRPIVASAAASHPPEIGYLRHNDNGWLAQDGGDPLRYAADVISLLDHPDALQRLQAGARRSADIYSTEDMARRFADGIHSAVTRPRRR